LAPNFNETLNKIRNIKNTNPDKISKYLKD